MTMHFRDMGAVRAAHPFPADEPHPTAIRMAETLQEQSGGGDYGVTFETLRAAGFSMAQIIEHGEAAKRMAERGVVRQVNPFADLIPDMVDKAVAGADHQPPTPRKEDVSQPLMVAWGAYCRSLAALKLDPSPEQYERAIVMLGIALSKVPVGAAVCTEIVARVEERLAALKLKGLTH